MDKEIFNEFSCNLEDLAHNVAYILKNDYANDHYLPNVLGEMPDGLYKDTIVKQRIGQVYFRNAVLKIYGNKCCVTGIDATELLIASHIKPWKDSDEHTERTNPCNGLCLNAFHDKAFDKGLITFDSDFKMANILMRRQTSKIRIASSTTLSLCRSIKTIGRKKTQARCII